MNRRLLCLLSLAFLLAPRPVHAQRSLTLDSCLALARATSPALRSADNAVRSSDLARAELMTSALPQVQAVLDGIYAPVPPAYGYDPAISDGGEIRGLVSVRQSVYDAGIRGLKRDQFTLDIDRLGRERRLAALDLTLAVKQAFYESLRARAEVGLQSESVEQLEGYLSLVGRLHNAGSASATDLLKTEIQTAAARIALAKAQETSVADLLSLEEAAGMPPDTSVVLAGSLEGGSVAQMDSSMAGAFDPDATLEMSVAGMLIRRSMLDEDIAWHERLPEVSLFADA